IHYAGNITAADFTPEQHKTITAAAIGQGRREAEARINTPAHAHLDGGSGGVAFFYALADDGKIDLVVYAKSTSRPRTNQYRWNNSPAPQVGPPPLEHVTNNPHLKRSQHLFSTSKPDTTTPPALKPPANKLPAPSKAETKALKRALACATALTNYHTALTTLTTSPDHITQTAAQLATHTAHLRTLGIDLFTHAWEQHPDATTPHHALALHIATTHPTPPANLTQTLIDALDLIQPQA
ncbi:hypothetical protein ACIOWI_38000, partial [Streptomyces sp. NPDC087659]|uniref:hypothetical protein n=1 Tax=Streptomyces sp. NPDC087659 TaxID=3365801 RepID=UPI00380B538A